MVGTRRTDGRALSPMRRSEHARAEDHELGERIVALVERLGGDHYAVFFAAYQDSLGAAPVPEYPGDRENGARARHAKRT